MDYNHIEHHKREDGKWAWRITAGKHVIATSGTYEYDSESDCLAGLFGIWFGIWDESFLGLYEKWQSLGGELYDNPPEAQEGVPVYVATDNTRPEQDLGDDPDGDASVDPRDT